jgi:hypothetical protein
VVQSETSGWRARYSRLPSSLSLSTIRKVVDAQVAVVLQEIGQAHLFVAQAGEQQDRFGAHPGHAVGNGLQLAPPQEGAGQKTLPPDAQPI